MYIIDNKEGQVIKEIGLN